MKLIPVAKLSFGLPVLILVAAVATAQTSQPGPSTPPVSYTSVSELNLMLSELEQASLAAQQDLSRVRVEKWKTDANTKRSSQSDIESIRRNLQNAVPEIIAQLRNSPENLATTFKLYRNVDALYDVFTSVAESAGAFGPRDEFQTLQNDLSALERSRRSFADRVEALAESKEGELARQRTELQALRAAAAAAPVQMKKVVVDDTEPPKKPAPKKPIRKPKPPSPTPAGTAPTQPPPAVPQP